jgi:hypothetical protein
MRFGDVTFQAVDSAGITVGTILLPDWTVRPGDDNPVTAVLTGDDGLSEIVSTFGDYGRHVNVVGIQGLFQEPGRCGRSCRCQN